VPGAVFEEFCDMFNFFAEVCEGERSLLAAIFLYCIDVVLAIPMVPISMHSLGCTEVL
jgi:hypothetical protein